LAMSGPSTRVPTVIPAAIPIRSDVIAIIFWVHVRLVTKNQRAFTFTERSTGPFRDTLFERDPSASMPRWGPRQLSSRGSRRSSHIARRLVNSLGTPSRIRLVRGFRRHNSGIDQSTADRISL
jgi:hypothetical protein